MRFNMQISSITNSNILQPVVSNKTTFKGDSEPALNVNKEDDKKYVKVPKWEHDLTNWIFGILTGVTVLQIIHELMKNRK